MHMSYGKTRVAGVPNTRNQRAKLAADYQELLKELSTKNIRSVGNYALEDTLGEGTYGKVKLATHKLTGQKVAIKIIPKLHAENLTREIHHHRYLHHPNIISLLEVIPTETEIYMVLEYCEGGELYDFLVERGRLRENLARKMFGQLCRAVKYCHDRRVVHRDLKLENILLDAYNNIKLGDFGFTRECESKKLLETICGSTGYSAPEMLLAKKYSGLEVDVWSLGVILYTLLCGALPFDDDDENEMKHKIIKGEYEMEEFLSNEAKDLIRSILQLEPSERPTLKQILQHAWFTIKDEEEEYNDDDDDDWATDEVADDESISSIEEENSVKEPTKEITVISHSKDSHLDATSHLERQRQEIFLTKQNTSSQNNYPMTYTRYGRYNNNDIAPSAFKSRMKVFTPAPSSSMQKTWGPSTSKTSRRSSIDSKAFNEKVLFTTPEEKELLEKLDSLGFDIAGIKNSVLEGKVDSASGLWWLLLTKLRKKKKIEGAQSSVTTVDVAVGTSDDEINIEEESEEENEVDSPINNAELDGTYHVEEEKVVENSEEIIPPTPPPKTYHAAPASRERRKSLILSHPEAVEPVLTTITAMASPPLSPKKYSSFTSPISSRSVSPIPLSNPAPMPIPNGKSNHRKKGFLSTLSTIKGWWVGSNNPKDANNAYKKSMLNWAESGVVVPADLVHTKSRFNRRSGNKTPPGYDGTNINLSRRSSINRNSLRDKKKKRGSIQGSKGNKRTTPAPITISPVTPSVVLSQNSPTSSSWGRKQVKRRSIGANSINILVDNFNAASGSGSSENNIINNQENRDTFEKRAIENIILDGFESKIIKEKSTIDEQLMVVESSKSKTIILASPPPTPPPNNIRTNPSQISKQEYIGLHKIDVSPHKISEETLASSDDGDESEYVDAASTFTSNPRSRTASPSPSTSASSSPNDSPVIKPDDTTMNPPAFPSPPSRQPIQISISPPRNLSQSPTSPVSPPLSPTDCDVDIPLRNKKSHNRLASYPPVHSDVLQTSSGRESPRSSSPTPSSPHLSKPFNKLLHSRSHSLPSTASSLNIVNEDNIEDNHHSSSNTNGAMNNGIDIPISSRRSESSFRRDSSPSPPNMPFNVSQMMFLHNNGINPRRGSPLTSRSSRRQPAMIMEEDEES
ncbi:unnamed protein product [Rhizophagus irregularis]|nr:unnamed protein product [Rhizophagus irregularis]CAB4438560.1 unnamed protein product [Rhizophagus irregularis]